MTPKEIEAFYRELIPVGTSVQDADKRIMDMKTDCTDAVRELFCNELLDAICKWNKREDKDVFCRHASLMSDSSAYFKAMLAFYEGRNHDCVTYIQASFEQLFDKVSSSPAEHVVTEEILATWYFAPMKEAFPGFWRSVENIVSQYAHETGVIELCSVICDYYECKTGEDAVGLLSNYICQFPTFILPKELLGLTYYELGMWNNAIAYFEAIEGKNLFISDGLLQFYTAFCFGKLKNTKQEEKYYRLALDIDPDVPITLNNLAHCLLKQKKYIEAKKLLEVCLDISPDDSYASNNYIRVLLSLGRNKDAKDFLKTRSRVSSSLKRKVESANNSNAKLSQPTVPDAVDCDDNEGEQSELLTRGPLLAERKQQFSSEKLLEDELTARIESGMEVFGMNLKMYRRKGEYGRQYIIPVGRLDLLCEDGIGNLYVIELKKDSGYDDAYEQTAMYLDWFERTHFAKEKSVYGIICLNSPTQALLDKVHKDKRMRLFEYQISYIER